MIWKFINTMWNWIVAVFESFEALWNTNIVIGDSTIYFYQILTTGFAVIAPLILARKIVRG